MSWRSVGIGVALLTVGCGSEAPKQAATPTAPTTAPAPEPDARKAVAPAVPQPDWREQFASEDPHVRRWARDQYRRQDNATLRDVRAALTKIRRHGPSRDLASAMRSDPELAFLALADHLGYAAVRVRREICTSLRHCKYQEPYVTALLLAHALLDTDDGTRRRASQALEMVHADAKRVWSYHLTAFGTDDESVTRIDVHRIATCLLAGAQGATALEAFSRYLHIFRSRIDGPRIALAHADLMFAAYRIAAQGHATARDEERLRLLWDTFRATAWERARWIGGDRQQSVDAVVRAMRWHEGGGVRDLLQSDGSPRLALAVLRHLGPQRPDVTADVVDRLLAGADPSDTYVAVRHLDASYDALVLGLRAIVTEGPTDKRLRAAAQLSAIAPLGDSLPYLRGLLDIEDGRCLDALRALVGCVPEDRALVRPIVEAFLAKIPAHAPRADRMRARQIAKLLDVTPTARRQALEQGHAVTTRDFAGHLDRWANPKLFARR